MTIETPRLILDTWQSSDWTDFRPIATNPEVMRYITGGRPWSDEEIRAFVDRQVQLYAERRFCRWKLLIKPKGEFIGFCGVGMWRHSPLLEIGWWLAPAYWGQGLATEAATAALRDVFERAQVDRVVSIAMPANTASRRIMEKLGLEFECEFDDRGVPVVRYAIDRVRYEARG